MDIRGRERKLEEFSLNPDLGIRCRGVLVFPLISASHQALLLWGLFQQMTALVAAGGHQGLQLVAVAALRHAAGGHRAASSSVLRGHSCGVQAARHLPVGRNNDSNIANTAWHGSFLLLWASWRSPTWICYSESWSTCTGGCISVRGTRPLWCLSRRGRPALFGFEKTGKDCKGQQKKKTYKCLVLTLLQPPAVHLVYMGT